MDDVSRAYFEMYGYSVINEKVSHDGEVKYQLMKEEVDTEAIKARIHKASKEASDPERTRKDVEKLHDKRRKEVNKLLRKEETRSDISLARSAVSAARKRAKEHPGIHKGDDTEFEHRLNKNAFKNLVKQEREKRSLTKKDINNEIDEGYVSLQGKPLKRVMSKVRDLSSDSQMIKSNPDYKRLAKQTGATDKDIKKAASKLEDRADKIISRISKHDPEAAKERETQNRKTISVRATPVNNKSLKEDVIEEVKTTYLPKSRERDIGRHDDWKDPHPDTRDWGEKSPKAKKLVRRAVAVIGTQRRQDKEVGLRKEEMELIISYLLENGYADTIEEVEDLIEDLSEEEFNSICEEVYEAFVPLDHEKEGLVHARLGDLSSQNKTLLARAKKLKAKPFSRYRPGVKRELQDMQTRAHKNLKLAKNAANSLVKTNQQKIDASNARSEDLKKKILHLKPKNKIVKLNREEHDIYDLVLDYLLENGYADTEKSAQNIMEAMSENWLETILDETLS